MNLFFSLIPYPTGMWREYLIKQGERFVIYTFHPAEVLNKDLTRWRERI